jgi:hypothetical protein
VPAVWIGVSFVIAGSSMILIPESFEPRWVVRGTDATAML